MRRLAAAFCAVLAFAAGAADAPRWYLRIDNDVLFGTDRWYSSGVRLACVEDRDSHELEWSLAQEVYTPESKRFAPGTIDRVPAARLHLGVARHDRTPQTFQSAELALGVRGSAALGRQATELIHRLVPAPAVDWSRQGRNRLDAQLAFTRTVSGTSFPLGGKLVPDTSFSFHYGAIVGNQQAFAHAGAELRLGAGDASTQLLRFAPTPPWSRAASRGWGSFLGASVRAVARNALLDQGYDMHAADPVRKRAVGRAAVGVSWAQSWGVATLALAMDSREFDSQREPHAFGALALHVVF